MRKRRMAMLRQRARWTVDEWQRAWELATMRIEGAPSLVESHPVYQECLTVLDGAFTQGNKYAFELGLIALMDWCADAVNGGDYKQWWD